MVTIYSKPEQTETFKFKGEAEATPAEKAEVGGEKFLQIDNVLFQDDGHAGDMADALLLRLKTRKEYFEVKSEFSPVPVEIRDTIVAEERVSDIKDVNHTGLLRGIRLSVTPLDQTLTLILEE